MITFGVACLILSGRTIDRANLADHLFRGETCLSASKREITAALEIFVVSRAFVSSRLASISSDEAERAKLRLNILVLSEVGQHPLERRVFVGNVCRGKDGLGEQCAVTMSTITHSR